MKINALVPDYYNKFACKCGECRDTCCQRWRITLSRSEYFRLIGLDVSAPLRRRLDTAFHLFDDATCDRYAFAAHDYNGFCKVLNDEGYCALQRECGEEVLPEVCRFFPRCVRKGINGEADTAVICLGCEETVELLMRKEKLTFAVEEISIPGDHIPDGQTYSLSGEEKAKMFSLIDNIQNAGSTLGDYLKNLAGNTESKEEEFAHTIQLVERLAQNSVNLQRFTDKLCGDFSVFAKKKAELSEYLPDVSRYMCSIFANHVYYMQLPCISGMSDERQYKTLYTAYLIAELFAAFCTEAENPKETFADVISAVFRMTEHSGFYKSV